MTTLHPPAYNLLEVLGLTRGGIYCSSCNRRVLPPIRKRKKEEGLSCQHCGHSNVYIGIRWQGKLVRLYQDKNGRSHSYSTALQDIDTINKDVRNKVFNPADWQPIAIAEKRIENVLKQWLARKAKECEDGRFAPSTLAAYRGYDRNHFATVKLDERGATLHSMDIREVRLKHLQTFYDQLAGSPKTKKNIIDALRAFFRWAKRWGEIGDVPTWPEVEEVVSKERFALTYDQQQEVLQRIPAAHRDIYEFMMETGLRPAEACALMVVDIDFKRRTALIRRTYSRGKLREKTKQKKEQWIPLSDRACELIKNNLADSEFVFKNPETGRGYGVWYLCKRWRQYSGAGVELYEATRHSFCTQIVEDGAGEFQAQKLMRHSSLTSTQKYYHPTGDRMRDIVNRRGRKVIPIEERKK